MRDENLYEDAEVGALRQEVMGRLDTLVKIWVRKVTEHKRMGDHMIAEANAKIYTFGSYRLGVHLPGMWLALSCQRLLLLFRGINPDDHSWSAQPACKVQAASGADSPPTPLTVLLKLMVCTQRPEQATHPTVYDRRW